MRIVCVVPPAYPFASLISRGLPVLRLFQVALQTVCLFFESSTAPFSSSFCHRSSRFQESGSLFLNYRDGSTVLRGIVCPDLCNLWCISVWSRFISWLDSHFYPCLTRYPDSNGDMDYCTGQGSAADTDDFLPASLLIQDHWTLYCLSAPSTDQRRFFVE